MRYLQDGDATTVAFLHYDKRDGRILQIGRLPKPTTHHARKEHRYAHPKTGEEVVGTIAVPVVTDHVAMQKPFHENAVVMEGHADLKADYVVDGKITPRPASPARLKGSILKGAPAGAHVTIGTSVSIADGADIELEFTYPGKYAVCVRLFPYLDAVFEITK